ncbi:MAG: riboflavin synthase [Verrucomicrobiia bacterium]
MFTGLIEEVGQVIALKKEVSQIHFVIQAPQMAPLLNIGDSVAVNGCCLTAIKIQDHQQITFDLLNETLVRTNFSQLETGHRVNLETAVKPTTHLGGHFVSGHVDTTACILALEKQATEWNLEIAIPQNYERYTANQGCIAIDGISLTIAETSPEKIRMSIVPHTWNHTNLAYRKIKDQVNLEFDLLAKYAEKILTSHTACSKP